MVMVILGNNNKLLLRAWACELPGLCVKFVQVELVVEIDVDVLKEVQGQCLHVLF